MTTIYFFLKVIILGIVEGITEFLPISSTGHLIIVGTFINSETDYFKLFEIVIQLGAILAIVVLYWKKILNSLKPSNLLPGKTGFKLWTKLILAFVPSGIIGFLLKDTIEKYLFSNITVSGALVVGGILMIYAEKRFRKNNKTNTIDEVSYFQAFKIGCFQCLAVLWPGFSRSASTIIGGWISGLSTVAAAEFSFFLALPTMIVATGYSLLKSSLTLTNIEVIGLGVGFLVSFIVALLVVDKFISYLQKKPMKVFAVYRIVIGLVILVPALIKLI